MAFFRGEPLKHWILVVSTSWFGILLTSGVDCNSAKFSICFVHYLDLTFALAAKNWVSSYQPWWNPQYSLQERLFHWLRIETRRYLGSQDRFVGFHTEKSDHEYFSWTKKDYSMNYTLISQRKISKKCIMKWHVTVVEDGRIFKTRLLVLWIRLQLSGNSLFGNLKTLFTWKQRF